jgi:hypothetical protein
MRKEIYQLVESVLSQIMDENNEPLIKHFDVFNQQILFITQERPFQTPAVFIDFNRIDWNYMSYGIKEADVAFNLYVVADSTTEKYSNSIEVFDLHDKIAAVLWNRTENNSDDCDGIGAITLQSSTTDNEFDELRADVDTYVCHVIDRSTQDIAQHSYQNVRMERL